MRRGVLRGRDRRVWKEAGGPRLVTVKESERTEAKGESDV